MQLRLIYWGVPILFFLGPLIAFGSAAISIWLVYRAGYGLEDSIGYGTQRVWWAFIPYLVSILVFATLRGREHSRNPFRCIVCNNEL